MEDEQEKDKKVLEFWDDENDVCDVLLKHKPEKPFTSDVVVSVNITFDYSDTYNRQKVLVGRNAYHIELWMYRFGYLIEEADIADIHVTKSYGDLPGIAFFMQEVE